MYIYKCQSKIKQTSNNNMYHEQIVAHAHCVRVTRRKEIDRAQLANGLLAELIHRCVGCQNVITYAVCMVSEC